MWDFHPNAQNVALSLAGLGDVVSAWLTFLGNVLHQHLAQPPCV